MNQLDRHDILLLTELQRDARQTVQQLAAAAGLSSTPCWKRVKEMEASGIIRGYTALVDREKVGLALCVLAEVNLTRHNEDDVRRFEQAVAARRRSSAATPPPARPTTCSRCWCPTSRATRASCTRPPSSCRA